MEGAMKGGRFRLGIYIKFSALFIVVITLLILIQNVNAGTYTDCVSCHNTSAPSTTGRLNISAMNLSSSAIHRNLTEGITNNSPISDGVVKACWACHWNGTDPDNTHPNKTSYTPWLCYDCHANTTGGIDIATDTGNYSAPSSYAHIPANAMGNYSTDYQTNITTTVQCWTCHNESVINANDSVGLPENNTAQSNVSHYGTTQFLVNNTAQNCTYCHVQDDSSIVSKWGSPIQIRHETNVSWCNNCHGNLSSSISFHSDQIKKEVSVHYAFDWEGDDDVDDGQGLFFPDVNRDEACYACHQTPSDMFTPGGANSTNTKYCEDCHLPNGIGPWTFSELSINPNADYVLRSDLSGWNVSNRTQLGIPVIYSHVPLNSIQNSTTNLNVSRNLTGESGETNRKVLSSCFSWNNNTDEGSCHGVSYSSRLWATPPTEVAAGTEYFMHYQERDNNDQNVSAPFMNTYIQDYAPNTTNCLWCHNQTNASVREYWGNATLIYFNRSNQSQYIGPQLMYGATNLSGCYFCHTTNQAAPNTFHVEEMNPGRACHNCHFNYSVMQGEFGKPEKWINESMFRNSVHGNFSILYCVNCHTMTDGHPPPESRWHWCEDCHVVMSKYANGTPIKDTQQRHNMTFKPQFSYVNVSGTMTSVINVTDCTLCHNTTMYNEARTIFNATSSKDCRFCHSFPDLNIDSPY